MTRTPTLRLRSALAWLFALVAFSFARHAVAQEVPLQPDPLFEKWCVAPLCTGLPDVRPALGPPPVLIAPSTDDGLLEQELKRGLSDALEAAAKATLGVSYDAAVADLATAIAATATADRSRLEKVGGLGAAVTRAAFAYYLDRLLPKDATCAGPMRIGAIYEGLALTVSLRQLRFPSKGKVAAACVDTSMAVARKVDQVVLATLVPEEVRREVVALVETLERTRRACGELPGASTAALARVKTAHDALAATTLSDTAKGMRTLRAAVEAPPPPPAPAPAPDASADAGLPATPPSPPPPPPSAAEAACTEAIAALRLVDPAALELLAKEGLREAPLGAVAASLAVPLPDAATVKLVRDLVTGKLGREELTRLVEALAAEVLARTGLAAVAPILEDAVRQLSKAVVLDGGRPTLDPNVVLAFLLERYGLDEDGKPTLRGLLGLKSTPLVFEANGGLPNVDLSGNVVADLTFGYSTKRFGVVGRGWINHYSLHSSATNDDYLQAGGSLDGWWLAGGGSKKLGVELRASASMEYYDIVSIPAGTSLVSSKNFDSRMPRGSLLAGIRYGAPGDLVSLQLLAGGGIQYEDPDTITYSANNAYQLASNQDWSWQGTVRTLVRLRLVPKVFSVRLRGEALYYKVSRNDDVFRAGQSPTAGLGNTVTSEQLEAHTRVFLDADLVSVAGFVPAVFTGVDYLQVNGTDATTTTIVSVLGVGIVRNSW